jgi:hypothetical protein
LCTDSQQLFETLKRSSLIVVSWKCTTKITVHITLIGTAFNRFFTTQTFGRLARHLSLRHGDRPSRPSQTDQDAAGQSLSFCKGTSLFRSCYNASFLTG